MLQRFGICETVHQRIASAGEINYPIVDPFTLVHAAVGVILSVCGLGLLPTMIIAACWEVAEHIGKNCVPDLFVFPSQDTFRNAVGDMAATALGWFLIRRAKEKVPKDVPPALGPDADLTPA